MATRDAARWAAFFPELDGADEVDRLLARLLPGSRPPGDRAEPTDPATPAATGGLDGLDLPELPFLPLVLALTGPVLAGTVADLRADPLVRADRAGLSGMLSPVAATLHGLVVRALVVDLHAASRAGRLSGDTPEARFAAFAAGLADPQHVRSFRRRYPLLVEDLHRTAGGHRRSLDAVLSAIRRHRPLLLERFPELAAAGRIVAVHGGGGDVHRGGASVAVLEFESGFRLVHKPRSLAVDEAWTALLARLQEQLPLGLRHPRIATAGDHGWMEFVDYSAPADAAAATAYYHRIGHLLALLYLFNGCDIHHENLVCAGDTPVLVDLETLFRPSLPVSAEASAVELAEERLVESVVGLGILPTVLVGADGSTVDVGVVGYEPGGRLPFKTLDLVNAGRDDMRVVFRRLEGAAGPASATVPPVSAGPLSAAQVLTALREGVARVGEWVLGAAGWFADLVDEVFAGVEVRYLHNPTFFYGQLLGMVTHPQLAADAEARRALLCRVGLRRPDAPDVIGRAEHRDLGAGDVPYFTALADGTVLFDSTGAPLGPVLRRSPLADARRKILALDRGVLDEQLHLIGLTLVNKYADGDTATGFGLDGPGHPSGGARERLAAALDIGDDLLAGMIRSRRPGHPATWIGPLISSVESRPWRPGPLGMELYAGTVGLAHYLAALHAVTGRPRFGSAALEVLDPLAADLAADGPADDAPAGYFDGTAGLLWVLAHAGAALDRPDLTDLALECLPGLRAGVLRDDRYDVISGTTGVLAVALALHRLARRPEHRVGAVELARTAAAHLSARYPCPDADGAVFTGFAHGVAGVLPYAAELHRLTGDPALPDLLRRLEEVLDELRTPDGTDWFTSSRRERSSYAWCHGSPGILLGLVLARRSGAAGSAAAERSTADAVNATIAGGLGNTATYCHGDVGNLEILGLAADVTGDRSLARRVERGWGRWLDCYLTRARGNPHSKFAYSTSAMVGSVAVGHGLLRSVVGDQVPSLLQVG